MDPSRAALIRLAHKTLRRRVFPGSAIKVARSSVLTRPWTRAQANDNRIRLSVPPTEVSQTEGACKTRGCSGSENHSQSCRKNHRGIDWRGWLILAWVLWFGVLYSKMVVERRGSKFREIMSKSERP